MHSDQVAETVAEHVTALRKQRNWTRAELAEQCKAAGFEFLTFSAITYIESGRRDAVGRRRRAVSVDELVAFSTLFGVDQRQLTGHLQSEVQEADDVLVFAIAGREAERWRETLKILGSR